MNQANTSSIQKEKQLKYAELNAKDRKEIKRHLGIRVIVILLLALLAVMFITGLALGENHDSSLLSQEDYLNRLVSVFLIVFPLPFIVSYHPYKSLKVGVKELHPMTVRKKFRKRSYEAGSASNVGKRHMNEKTLHRLIIDNEHHDVEQDFFDSVAVGDVLYMGKACHSGIWLDFVKASDVKLRTL